MKDINLILADAIVLCMLAHREAECLTHDVVKWHSQEVASEGQQTHAIHAIELAPLCLLFE